jgi:hypothetical protein
VAVAEEVEEVAEAEADLAVVEEVAVAEAVLAEADLAVAEADF